MSVFRAFFTLYCFSILAFSCRNSQPVSSTVSSNTLPQQTLLPTPNDWAAPTTRIYEKRNDKDALEEILDNLLKNELLDSISKNTLSKANLKDTLHSNFEIIRALKDVFLISTDTIKKEFPGFYIPLLQAIAQKYALQYQSLDITKMNKDSAVITLTTSHRSYSLSLKSDTTLGKLDESFYEIFNFILAENKTPERIYLVKKLMVNEIDSNLYYSTDNKEYGLLKLNRIDAAVFYEFPTIAELSTEIQRPLFSEKETYALLKTLDSAGFFSELKQEEKLKVFKELKNEPLYTLEDIFYLAKPLHVCIDNRIANYQKPFQEALLKVAAFSGNKFFPQAIQDASIPNSATEISFSFKGKTYSGTFVSSFDQIDIQGLINLVNRALNESGTDGNFYILDKPGLQTCYIFMTEQEVQVANALNGKR